jgi:dTDP-4-amino-4,6-dideoxygalactose transaminase
MPIYKHPYYNYNGTFKGAEEYYNKAISLPIFPNITIDELNIVVDCVKKYFDINMKKLK